jgi:hypothetical protein
VGEHTGYGIKPILMRKLYSKHTHKSSYIRNSQTLTPIGDAKYFGVNITSELNWKNTRESD